MITESRARGSMIAIRIVVMLAFLSVGATARAEEAYHCYFGNTHSHTSYSDGKETPADHFRKARTAGYDFYAVTDHALARCKRFTTQSYEDTKREADRFTDSAFVAIAGFEFTESDGPGGKGHLTVLNTQGYLDATGNSVDLGVFYDWLVTNQPTTVAASFNHPDKSTYNGFDYLTDARRDGVTMYEMINNRKLRYDGFFVALRKGWRVAPIGAEDGHGTDRIATDLYRTGVLATSLTRENIMQGIRQRRVYCTWDKNLRLTFSANGRIMGSVLNNPASVDFRVSVYDPDATDANDRITRIEIVGDDDTVVAAKDFSSHAVTWAVTASPHRTCYFAKVYAADKTDGPTAYSAPIWVEGATPDTAQGQKAL